MADTVGIATYVVTPPSVVAATDLCTELDGGVVAESTAILLCRELPPEARPSMLPPAPPAPGPGRDVPMHETWATDLRWLARRSMTGSDPPSPGG